MSASLNAPFLELRPQAGLDLRQILRRNLLTVALTTVLAFALVVAVTLNLTPRYYAEGTLMPNERQSRVVAFEQVLSQIPGDIEGVQGEVQVLRSRDVAQRTVAELGLHRYAEFDPWIDDGRPVSAAKRWVRRQLWENLGIGRAPRPIPGEPVQIAVAANLLLDPLNAWPIGRSRAIGVSYLGQDGERSADIVDTHMRLHSEQQLELKVAATPRAVSFLSAQVTEMRERVQQAEAAVEGYRANAGLARGTGVQNARLVEQQLAEATSRLAIARARREEAEARAASVSDPDGAGAVPEAMASTLVGRLQEQEVAQRAEVTRTRETLGPRHPSLNQLERGLAATQARIRQKTARIATSLRSEAEVQRRHEAALAATVDRLRSQVGESNAADVVLRALTREAEAARGLLQALLTRQQEVSAGEALLQAELDRLRDLGARIAGVVLTQVDVKRHSLSGHADSGVLDSHGRSYDRN
jgi:uncharacterized protein involved in exopolysaccharide biosynthesis